jgi:hypothetical protein
VSMSSGVTSAWNMPKCGPLEKPYARRSFMKSVARCL